ncbi:MAG: DMT family transporter [Candidatus Magasanikbacteria bacterium]|nr:DMT family transporter [Candidatus Magasanikbacteria bacterium]
MWLLITAVAYFLNAIAAVVDKFLISKKISNSAVYAFYISALGLSGLILIPWGFGWIGWWNLAIVLAAGVTFTCALLHLFKGLAVNESSRITPFIGGLSPIFVFIFSFFLLGERLVGKQPLAFILIIIGTVFISLGKSSKKNLVVGFWYAGISALMFGVSYTLTKLAYNNVSFINGFVWLRITTFIGGLFLLYSAANRRDIFHPSEKTVQKAGPLFLFGQVAGAASFLLINYAISISSVTIVNALQGLQYVFLLIMILILARLRPQVLEEKLRGVVLTQKISAIVLIGAGLYLLV